MVAAPIRLSCVGWTPTTRVRRGGRGDSASRERERPEEVRGLSPVAHAPSSPFRQCYFTFFTVTACTYKLRSYSPSLYTSLVYSIEILLSPFLRVMGNLYSFASLVVSVSLPVCLPSTASLNLAPSFSASSPQALTLIS